MPVNGQGATISIAPFAGPPKCRDLLAIGWMPSENPCKDRLGAVTISMALHSFFKILGRKDVRVKKQKKRPGRDIEKSCSKGQFVAKLRRLADCIEQNKRFQVQVAGEKILIPPTAIISIEHERGSSQEEVEFQLKWPLEKRAKKASA
jgi:amphi-Trp domain-containing protein